MKSSNDTAPGLEAIRMNIAELRELIEWSEDVKNALFDKLQTQQQRIEELEAALLEIDTKLTYEPSLGDAAGVLSKIHQIVCDAL